MKMKETYLLFQPVIVLDNACHHYISTLHVESDLSCGFILVSKNTVYKIKLDSTYIKCPMLEQLRMDFQVLLMQGRCTYII